MFMGLQLYFSDGKNILHFKVNAGFQFTEMKISQLFFFEMRDSNYSLDFSCLKYTDS